MSLEACFVLFLFSGRFKAMSELQSVPVDLTALLFVATLCLMGRAVVSYRIRPPSATLPVLLMIVFSELAAVSLFWSSLTWINIDKVGRFLLFTSPSYFMAGMIAQDPVRRARLVRMMAAASCAILGYYAIYRYALGIDMVRGAVPSAAWVPSNANNYLEYGEQASILFTIVLASGVLGRRRYLWAAILGMGTSLFLLLSMGGRGPLLYALLAVPLLAMGILVRRRGPRRRVARLVILVAGVAGLGAAAYEAAEHGGMTATEIESSFRTLDRIQLQLSREDTNSLDERSEGRQLATQQWLVKPILGWGIGEFRVQDSYLAYPHNLLLEVLMEMGIVGGILFFSTCMVSLHACAKVATDGKIGWVEAAIALLFVIDLASRFTVQGYLADDRIFFALAGMALGTHGERPAPRVAARGPFSGRPKPGVALRRGPGEPKAETP